MPFAAAVQDVPGEWAPQERCNRPLPRCGSQCVTIMLSFPLPGAWDKCLPGNLFPVPMCSVNNNKLYLMTGRRKLLRVKSKNKDSVGRCTDTRVCVRCCCCIVVWPRTTEPPHGKEPTLLKTCDESNEHQKFLASSFRVTCVLVCTHQHRVTPPPLFFPVISV